MRSLSTKRARYPDWPKVAQLGYWGTPYASVMYMGTCILETPDTIRKEHCARTVLTL